MKIYHVESTDVTNVPILYHVSCTEFGPVFIATLNNMICSLQITNDQTAALAKLKHKWPNHPCKSSEALEHLVEKLTHSADVDWPLLLKGSAFQYKVWQALLEIPFGQTTHYQAIADQIGQLKAVRAVGSAIGKNPIGFLIPCHRVLPKQGGIGQYAWGGDIKAKIIDWERSHQQCIANP